MSRAYYKEKIGVSLEIEPQTFGFCASMLYHACTHLRVALNSTIEHHGAKSEGVDLNSKVEIKICHICWCSTDVGENFWEK